MHPAGALGPAGCWSLRRTLSLVAGLLHGLADTASRAHSKRCFHV